MCTIKYVRVEICVSETTRILTCPEAIVYICVDSRRSETTTHASFEIRTTPNSCTNLGESRMVLWLAQEYGMIIVERSSSERIPPRSRKFGETGALGAIPTQKGDCSGCSRMAHSQSSHSDDSVHSPSSFLSSPSEICSLHPSLPAMQRRGFRGDRSIVARCSVFTWGLA